MFGNSRNGISVYQKAGAEAAVEVADPCRLILLLFEGAQAAIGKARVAMQLKQIATKGEAVSKAIDIISNGLRVSLDKESGGQIAVQLEALYEYMVLRLLQANMKNDLKALEEVSGLLEEIHSAWRDMPPVSKQQAVA